MGFRTIECEDGAYVTEQLSTCPEPWVIFMDIKMNEKDGIEAIEDLRYLPNDIRIRFMTGGEMVNAVAARMIAEARSLKVRPTLFKPFDLNSFKDLLIEETSEKCGDITSA